MPPRWDATCWRSSTASVTRCRGQPTRPCTDASHAMGLTSTEAVLEMAIQSGRMLIAHSRRDLLDREANVEQRRRSNNVEGGGSVDLREEL